MNDGNHLVNLLNASGFAFQLAVEHLVSAHSDGVFKIAGCEHPWRHPTNNRTGFIDIVVEKYGVRFVIECKRARDASWLFLVPDKQHESVSIFNCYWNCLLAADKSVASWSAVHLKPNHPLSSFCCTRGKGEGDAPFLDNIGAGLVYAAEALATEEASLRDAHYEETTIYLPVIVTNAELYTGVFDPAAVGLKSGCVDNCTCAEAGVVRYRKALDPESLRGPSSKSIKEVNSQSQRSLFVVNIEHFASFLGDLHFISDVMADYPWMVAKRRYADGRAPI